MFWSKNEKIQLNSAEYESCAKKLTELSARIEELETKFKILGTNYDNLRGNFNRKLSGLKKEEEPETDNNLKPNMFLNPNGHPI